MSKEFLQSVDKKVTKQRPPWRVNAANVDTSHDSALILNDHSLFSRGKPFRYLKRIINVCLSLFMIMTFICARDF